MNEKRPNGFLTFLRGLNIFRLVIINCIFFFLLILIFTLMFAGANKMPNAKAVSIESGSVLIVSPSGILVETRKSSDWKNKLLSQSYSTVLLEDIVKAIRNAGHDRRIEAMFFNFNALSGVSLGHLEELSSAIDEYKMSGKPYYAFASYYGVTDYYLARKADRICLDPFGVIDFSLFSADVTFYKGMEEKLGVDWNVIQAGAYKGAAEVYSESKLSNNVRSNYEAVFGDFWNSFVESCAVDRKINKSVINNFAKNHLEVLKKTNGDEAQLALNLGLVTDIMTFDDFIQDLDIADKYNTCSRPSIFYDEFNTTIKNVTSQNHICVINLDGAITSNPDSVSGNLNSNIVSGEVVNKLEMAMDDDSIKAIVLRINSGGGEVGASETIRRAVLKTKRATNKPVVVSMGSVAASGAYWIASASDYIFANKYTVTGSIGVLATIPSFKRGLEKYFGITSDAVYAGQKPIGSQTQELTAEDLEILKLNIADTYNKFLKIVSAGRALPIEDVAKYAGGRIYSGKQALDIKLIDELGTLDSAIKYAAKLAGCEDNYVPTRLKTEYSLLDTLMNDSMNLNLNYFNFPVLNMYLELMSLNNSDSLIHIYTPIRVTPHYKK